MAASALICAHRNPFNQSVLRDNALFFANEHEIADAVKGDLFGERREKFISANLKRIETDYRWDDVINSYYHCFQTLLRKSINVIPIPIHRDGSET